MTLSVYSFIAGAAIFLVGSAFGYWLLRWKERNLRAAQSILEKAVLEGARANADALIREARLTANEDALKLREQTEQLFAARRKDLDTSEQRLNERESLVNRQLEKVMQEETMLRDMEQDYRGKEHQIEVLH